MPVPWLFFLGMPEHPLFFFKISYYKTSFQWEKSVDVANIYCGYVQIHTIWQMGHFNRSKKQNLNMVKFRKMWFIRFHLIYFEKRDPSNEMIILIQKLVYRMLDLLMASSHHWNHLFQLTYANFADRLDVEYQIVVVSVKKS